MYPAITIMWLFSRRTPHYEFRQSQRVDHMIGQILQQMKPRWAIHHLFIHCIMWWLQSSAVHLDKIIIGTSSQSSRGIAVITTRSLIRLAFRVQVVKDLQSNMKLRNLMVILLNKSLLSYFKVVTIWKKNKRSHDLISLFKHLKSIVGPTGYHEFF